MTRTCQCGCGAEVKRNFKPGHDAKLKSALLEQSRSQAWWVRETAVLNMIERGWGHFVDVMILALVPVRGRHNGTWTETRRIEECESVRLDEAGLAHSHGGCPAVTGAVTVSTLEEAGWPCGACIHTESWSEQVGRAHMLRWLETNGGV